MLENIRKNKLERVIAHCVTQWVNELIQKSVTSDTPNIYLSLIAVFLRCVFYKHG